MAARGIVARRSRDTWRVAERWRQTAQCHRHDRRRSRIFACRWRRDGRDRRQRQTLNRYFRNAGRGRRPATGRIVRSIDPRPRATGMIARAQRHRQQPVNNRENHRSGPSITARLLRIMMPQDGDREAPASVNRPRKLLHLVDHGTRSGPPT